VPGHHSFTIASLNREHLLTWESWYLWDYFLSWFIIGSSILGCDCRFLYFPVTWHHNKVIQHGEDSCTQFQVPFWQSSCHHHLTLTVETTQFPGHVNCQSAHCGQLPCPSTQRDRLLPWWQENERSINNVKCLARVSRCCISDEIAEWTWQQKFGGCCQWVWSEPHECHSQSVRPPSYWQIPVMSYHDFPLTSSSHEVCTDKYLRPKILGKCIIQTSVSWVSVAFPEATESLVMYMMIL